MGNVLIMRKIWLKWWRSQQWMASYSTSSRKFPLIRIDSHSVKMANKQETHQAQIFRYTRRYEKVLWSNAENSYLCACVWMLHGYHFGMVSIVNKRMVMFGIVNGNAIPFTIILFRIFPDAQSSRIYFPLRYFELNHFPMSKRKETSNNSYSIVFIWTK